MFYCALDERGHIGYEVKYSNEQELFRFRNTSNTNINYMLQQTGLHYSTTVFTKSNQYHKLCNDIH